MLLLTLSVCITSVVLFVLCAAGVEHGITGAPMTTLAQGKLDDGERFRTLGLGSVPQITGVIRVIGVVGPRPGPSGSQFYVQSLELFTEWIAPESPGRSV